MSTSALQPKPTGGGNTILEVIRLKLGDLRKSDRKVAELAPANPKRMVSATIAEAAEWAGVSQPTAIRFCASIGCQGYQDFKPRLAQNLALGMSATHSVIDGNDTPARVSEKILDYTIASLNWVCNHLDPLEISRAVDALANAGRIEFFGFGASCIVARDAQQEFLLSGAPCGAETDAHQQIMVVSNLKPGDVAVVISNTGATLTVIDILSTGVTVRRGDEHVDLFMRMKHNLRYLRISNEI